jgi:hypothetical protein
MVSSNNPARIPESQTVSNDPRTLPRPAWRREKKHTRFVVKLSGIIPS